MTLANEFLRKAVSKSWGELPVQIKQLPNGQYRANEGLGTINTPPGVCAATLVHEFGHRIEEASGNTLGTLSKAFAMQQLIDKDQKPEHLGGAYEADEIGNKDEFQSSYTGKFYPQDASEVLSMGVQNLYEDPITFFEEAPKHFEYTLACLHGLLTPGVKDA